MNEKKILFLFFGKPILDRSNNVWEYLLNLNKTHRNHSTDYLPEVSLSCNNISLRSDNLNKLDVNDII